VAISVAEESVRGDAMVTRDGLEGGPVYAHSAAIRAALEEDGGATILVDLHPDLTIDEVTERLAHRRPKDSLASTLRRIGLSPVAIGLLREATGNRLPNDPTDLARLVKAAPLVVDATMPLEKAISTAGGIALDEIDDS